MYIVLTFDYFMTWNIIINPLNVKYLYNALQKSSNTNMFSFSLFIKYREKCVLIGTVGDSLKVQGFQKFISNVFNLAFKTKVHFTCITS
jgi:hypothetical protein